tara:strand:- start:728 stop:1012 length:285 start_codon:yes stop_codon:yes gene_type:complete
MTQSNQLRTDIEVAAKALGVSPSTVGEKAGQGGQFYSRLVNGKRVWPETAEKVRKTIADLLVEQEAKATCDVSHEADSGGVQGHAAGKSAQVSS